MYCVSFLAWNLWIKLETINAIIIDGIGIDSMSQDYGSKHSKLCGHKDLSIEPELNKVNTNLYEFLKFFTRYINVNSCNQNCGSKYNIDSNSDPDQQAISIRIF